MNTAQAILDAQDELVSLRNQSADLQGQVDSLRTQVDQQDSLIRVLANLAGVRMPPKQMPGIPPP
jgi:phage shock protein A